MRYAIFGGFLGSGKTSAEIKLAEYAASIGLRPAIITNDQSVGLVDTNRILNAGFPAREVTGSCFCCNFNGLVEASQTLATMEEPQLIIVEPVGSCTDLKATVCNPLQELHEEEYDLAPLSVLVDPFCFGDIFGITSGKGFSENIRYIYKKQLEEADIIVINKIDLITPSLRHSLVHTARTHFRQAKIFEVSCLSGEGLEAWFNEILGNEHSQTLTLDIDYDTYADGEARLGWLNATVDLKAMSASPKFLIDLTTDIQTKLASLDIEIAHLKMAMVLPNGKNLGTVSLTNRIPDPVITYPISVNLEDSLLLINLRAEGDPEVLKETVSEALARHTPPFSFTEVSAFRPGRPKPTHRIVSLV